MNKDNKYTEVDNTDKKLHYIHQTLSIWFNSWYNCEYTLFNW
jgi:hypothetical protein